MVVVKIGGALRREGSIPDPALADLAALVGRGEPVVAVHGGGPEITAWCDRLGLKSEFVAGRRRTDAETAAVAEMVLCGRVGKALAAAMGELGVPAVSLSGKDAGLFVAEKLAVDGIDLGFVGRVAAANPGLLHVLLQAGFLPLVAPVAGGPDRATYNINADEAAAALAVALGARALVLATDVAGVLMEGGGVLPECDAALARRLIGDGVIRGGMQPKVEACLRAVEEGVGTAWIVDGRQSGALLAAATGEGGAGTAFRSGTARAAAGGR